MVGVPGRSKACHTCKKRRVKCDETKPECTRCMKAGYKCSGYERALEFRIATQSSQGVVSHSTAQPTPKNSISVVPKEISLIAFRSEMQYAFLFSNFVWSTYGCPWLQLSALGKLGVLSQQACSAFSLVTFGRHHSCRDLELNGVEGYNQAVSKVRGALTTPSNPAFSQLLVPVLIFLLVSSSNANQSESHGHIMGLFTLLQVAGPKAFRQPALRGAFSSCRATLVTVGLLQRMRLFLEDETWKTEPWSLDPVSKSPQDELVDILVHVPGFLQDQQAIRRDCDQLIHQHLVQKVLDQLFDLFSWRWEWERCHTSAARVLSTSQGNSERTFPKANLSLQYRSFALAVEMSLYNAVLLCLLGILYSELSVQNAHLEIKEVATKAQSRVHNNSDSALALPTPENISMRSTAVEIVCSFEYQLNHIHDTNGTPALFWLFPLGLASKVLKKDPGMALWIQQMLEKSEVTRGYGRGDNAFGFGFYELPDVNENPC